MPSSAPDIIKCPNCRECMYDYWLCKADGTMCPSCHYAEYMTGELPRGTRCTSKHGLCTCNDDYLRSKGILLADGTIKPGYCHECFRKLVPIGTARSGGAQHHGDWVGRQYHKKCWKMLQEED